MVVIDKGKGFKENCDTSHFLRALNPRTSLFEWHNNVIGLGDVCGYTNFVAAHICYAVVGLPTMCFVYMLVLLVSFQLQRVRW